MESFCEICFAGTDRSCKALEYEAYVDYRDNKNCPFFKTQEKYIEQLKDNRQKLTNKT